MGNSSQTPNLAGTHHRAPAGNHYGDGHFSYASSEQGGVSPSAPFESDSQFPMPQSGEGGEEWAKYKAAVETSNQIAQAVLRLQVGSVDFENV